MAPPITAPCMAQITGTDNLKGYEHAVCHSFTILYIFIPFRATSSASPSFGNKKLNN